MADKYWTPSHWFLIAIFFSWWGFVAVASDGQSVSWWKKPTDKTFWGLLLQILFGKTKPKQNTKTNPCENPVTQRQKCVYNIYANLVFCLCSTKRWLLIWIWVLWMDLWFRKQVNACILQNYYPVLDLSRRLRILSFILSSLTRVFRTVSANPHKPSTSSWIRLSVETFFASGFWFSGLCQGFSTIT